MLATTVDTILKESLVGLPPKMQQITEGPETGKTCFLNIGTRPFISEVKLQLFNNHNELPLQATGIRRGNNWHIVLKQCAKNVFL